jgi:hypothetical protein
MKQLIEIIENLRVRGIGFRSLTEALDTTTAQGWRAFDDAFARYLASKNVTASQPQHSRGIGADSKTSHRMECDVSESRRMPSEAAPCDGVTLSEDQCDDAFDERAAIHEFDGGFSRAEAERLTRDEGSN